jgi:hypothetical protein
MSFLPLPPPPDPGLLHSCGAELFPHLLKAPCSWRKGTGGRLKKRREENPGNFRFLVPLHQQLQQGHCLSELGLVPPRPAPASFPWHGFSFPLGSSNTNWSDVSFLTLPGSGLFPISCLTSQQFHHHCDPLLQGTSSVLWTPSGFCVLVGSDTDPQNLSKLMWESW